MSELLNKVEIELLPSMELVSVPEGFTLNNDGLIYDGLGRVVGKKPSYLYNPSIEYHKLVKVLPDNEEPSDELLPLTWSEVKNKDFPPDQWRIQGLVPKNGITFLAGVSGEKKTWLALHMAFAIVSGGHLFGHDNFKSNKGKVLYIDAESGWREIKRRGELLKFNQLPSEQLLILSEITIDLRNEDTFETISQLLISNKIDVLIIDTLRGVAGGLNEDKAEEVRGFLQRFNVFKHRGISVILLDHCRKPIRNEGFAPKKEQLLGSQDKVASAESVIMLKSELGASGFTVYQVKSRTGVEIKPFMAQMVDKPEDGCIEFQYSGEYDEQVSKMDSAKLLIPQIIGTGTNTTKQIVEIMSNEHKIGERYVRDALRQLENDETLVVEKKGREKAYKNSQTGLLIAKVGEVFELE